MLERKNIELFEEFGIFSEAEVRARYEVSLENYTKALHIEALTMLDMVRRAAAGLPQAEGTGFLPAGQTKQSDPPGRSQSTAKDPTSRRSILSGVLLAVLVILALGGVRRGVGISRAAISPPCPSA